MCVEWLCRIDILSFAFHCILFTSSPFILLQLPYIDAVWTLVNLHFLFRTALQSGVQVFSLIRFSCHAHSHHTLYTFQFLWFSIVIFILSLFRCAHSFHPAPGSLVQLPINSIAMARTYHIISMKGCS